MKSERWYIAVLVVTSRVETATGDPLQDLQFRLIRALDNEHAYHLAEELGARETTNYRNAHGEQVSWRYIGLHDLRELEQQELSHGVEVYSRLTRRPANELLVAKDKLTCFWVEANQHRMARDMLGE